MRNKASTDVSKASTDNIHQRMSASTDKASTDNASTDKASTDKASKDKKTIQASVVAQRHEFNKAPSASLGLNQRQPIWEHVGRIDVRGRINTNKIKMSTGSDNGERDSKNGAIQLVID
ncbi:hypothetical protein AgCh_013664 [Apium graveolens]